MAAIWMRGPTAAGRSKPTVEIMELRAKAEVGKQATNEHKYK